MRERVVSTGNAKLSHNVARALAAVKDVDPCMLDPPLYEVVDIEALERLVESGATRIQFAYGPHEVSVDGDGTVTVDGTVYVSGHAPRSRA